MIDKIDNSVDVLTHRDYVHAQRRAFWRKVRSWLGRNCNDLLPAERVLKNIPNQKSRNLGLQQVPLERIVGSSGRCFSGIWGNYPGFPDRKGWWGKKQTSLGDLLIL